MFGLLNSAIASSAALRMDWPARPALPAADNGSTSATLTWPVPMVAAGPAWGGGALELLKRSPGEKPPPPQADKSAAAAPTNRTRRAWRCGARVWRGGMGDIVLLEDFGPWRPSPGR